MSGIDFSDPIWLRLGFVNDKRYNWYTAAPDVHRGDRDRRFWMGLARWQHHHALVRHVPVSRGLCRLEPVLARRRAVAKRRGHYPPLRHATMACRTLDDADVGREIFAVAIKPGSLAMTLHPPAGIEARLLAEPPRCWR